ncbi:hypothetical protein PMZ80_006411 [Knufia obscura]|uniref:Uncharacterized protein n=2 Tax=Knufia TaxID=430999 RepID=A0AAN8ELA9_9EURO|nr:hypothetical protein PMZ80_006411 [Knufia obscura]KAK5953442.1 hypothetical protein OHC33_005386 [Knufia fluminis]
MSQSTQAASSQIQPTSQSQPTVARPPNPFAKFDDRIAEVCNRIVPKHPYVITIPSAFPYRRHTTDPNRWYRNTPFVRKEEQLQYMSLLLHQDDDESLLKVDGDRIDEDGRLVAHQPTPQSGFPSRPQTPVETGPKKKITLKDYKTKDKSAVNTPERRPADDIRRQAIKSHKEEADAKRQDLEPKPKPQTKPEQEPTESKPAVQEPKPETKASLQKPTQHDRESQRPAKKRRLSDEGEDRTPKHANGLKTKEEPAERRALPNLLSPDMPTPGKKPKTRDLPALLSPKLPQALEKVAAAPSQRSDEVRAILKGISSPARASDKKSDGVARDVSPARVRSDSQLSAKSAAPVAKVASPVSRPLSTPASKVTATLTNGRTASPKPRQRHIIVLRYGKKNRKRVEMLLKLGAPRPKKEQIQTAERERPTSLKQPAKVDAPKSDKKRPAEPTPDPPAKKPKLAAPSLEPPAKIDRPSTPRPDTAGRSPASTAKPKSTFSTPKKELKSAAMHRVASTDTSEARTPSQEVGRTSTPLGVNNSSQPKTSPAPTSTPAKSEEQAAWTDINTRIFQLGRTLKKEGSKLAEEGGSKKKQQGVVLLIEALLCFMLNAAAQAQARPNVDPGWSTILPYHVMVRTQSRPYKHLHGLVVQLGAVCRQFLHQEHIKRLSKETLPDDHIGSAPTPGSDGNTRTDDSAKKQKSFLELRDDLLKNSKELKIAWLEGSRTLPYDVIEDQYPGTWSRRAKDFSKRNPDKLNPKELTKDFYLPLDVSTNVFEATNFALAFLNEWAMIEQVQWKTRIEL